MKPALLLLLTLALSSCGLMLQPDGADAQYEHVRVARYDRLQSRYLSTGDFSALQTMNTEYAEETRNLVESVLQIGEVTEPDISTRFLRFYQDSTLQALITDVGAEYGDMTDVDELLAASFSRLHQWLPDMPCPRVYAQIGALDQSVVVDGQSVGISLDKYLGEHYPLYQKYFSYQQRIQMTRSYIVPDCITIYLLSLYPMDGLHTQRAKDLHIAKMMWVANQAMDRHFFDTPDVRLVEKYMRRHARRRLPEFLSRRGSSL